MAKNKKDNLIVKYDSDVDALSLALKSGKETSFEEIAPGVSVEFDNKGDVIGFEVLNASRRLKNTILPLSKKTKAIALSR